MTASGHAERRQTSRPTAYRSHVLAQLESLLRPLPAAERALDFGAGDGWFAREIGRRGLAKRVVAADVLLRPEVEKKPVIFDGTRLPFGDRTFDLTYAVDVIHHCAEPERALDEVLRCTRLYFLLKDHSYRNIIDWSALCVLDELGNRRFGVPSPHRYQERWSWNDYMTSRGFLLEHMIHPAKCHTGILGALTNHLQFVALWRRSQP